MAGNARQFQSPFAEVVLQRIKKATPACQVSAGPTIITGHKEYGGYGYHLSEAFRKGHFLLVNQLIDTKDLG